MVFMRIMWQIFLVRTMKDYLDLEILGLDYRCPDHLTNFRELIYH